MEELETLKAWLQTYPKWEGVLLVDHTQAQPGHFGLYPLGQQIRSVRRDVLGNLTVRCRSQFRLYRVTAAGDDNTVPAAWLMDLQAWIRDQWAAGLAPAFGDVPQEEQLFAGEGRLERADQVGTGTYAVTLTAEYTKIYREEG